MNTDSNQPKLTRKQREFIARRQEILEAATRLFAKKGYHGTTMGEIAKEAEFSTGSLYTFFKNKEELYFKLLEEKIAALESCLQDVVDSEGGVQDKLKLYVDTVFDYFEQDRDFFQIFAEQRGQFELSAKGQWSDVIMEKYQNYLGNMVKLMQVGIDEGLFKPLEPSELAMIFLGVMNTMLFIYFNQTGPYQLHDKSGLVLDVFFDGTRK